MTRIYLVRHAEAEGNRKRIFQGHIDADVSEMGRKQLVRLAERFSAIHLDALYSSPLRRAYKTAEAVNSTEHLPIFTDKDLMEIDGGCWEGNPWGRMAELFPKDNDAWENHPWDFAPEGGEPMRHVYERMWRAVGAIAARHPGKTVGIVSHGCAIRNYLCRVHGWPIERLNDVAWCDNTAVSIVDYADDGGAELKLENDASHLDGGLSTFARQTWWKKGTKA